MSIVPIHVTLHPSCLAAKKYVLHCLFSEFLGVSYEVSVDEECNETVISMPTKRLVINDHFYGQEAYWLSESSLPQEVRSYDLQISDHSHQVLGLYHSAEFRLDGDEIHLGFDLLSATFFMLSRWEEKVSSVRDAHDRFPGHASFAYQQGFLQRPIVNEYVELLKTLLRMGGYTAPFRAKEYKLVPTHDVDFPYLWTSGVKKYTSLIGSIVRGQSYQARQFVKHLRANRDPYDTHGELMDRAEAADVIAQFNFLVNGHSPLDGNYDVEHPRLRPLIDEIRGRGHQIGLHPSYDSYQEAALFAQQKKRLEQVVGTEVKTGRQHFLRFQNPATWQMWEQAGMEVDSTIGYADLPGFRCGVCYSFPVFDIDRGEMLSLREQPLIVMDATLKVYQKVGTTEGLQTIKALKDQVKKYNGEFVFLWHNSSIGTELYKDSALYLDELYR